MSLQNYTFLAKMTLFFLKIILKNNAKFATFFAEHLNALSFYKSIIYILL